MDTKRLGQQLGKHLYEMVTLHGTGLFFARSWELVNHTARSVSFPKERSFDDFLTEIRSVGGDAWDDVANPNDELNSMR